MTTRERKRLHRREVEKILDEYEKFVVRFFNLLPYAISYDALYQKFHWAWQEHCKFMKHEFKLKMLKPDPKWFHDDFHPEEQPFEVKFNLFKYLR